METLKPLAELCAPDERQSSFSVRDSVTPGFRPIKIDDIYDRAASIKLHAGVPEQIRSHFAASQNLLAFSWYYYPFNVTAQFLAYVSVESALKARYPGGKRPSFRGLVRRAVRQGLVKDSGFSHIQEAEERASTMEQAWYQQQQQVTPYVEVLIETMPSLRNSLAHGEYMLHMHGATHVRICAEFINQLFSEPSPNDG